MFNLDDKPSARLEVPDLPALSFLGTPGQIVWTAPETQDPELIWPGWDTEQVPAGVLDGDSALNEVRSTYESLPPETIDNRDSIYGWPEDRLRFTESYVYTYLGVSAAADGAQDAAIRAYPRTYRRGPAQIELQRALWMVNNGDVNSGVQHASAAMQSLPSNDQIRPIVALAKEVLGAVPAVQAKRAAVVEFRECLELTSSAE